jgi:hypothetical protein
MAPRYSDPIYFTLQQSWNFERPKELVISKFTIRTVKVVLSAIYLKYKGALIIADIVNISPL